MTTTEILALVKTAKVYVDVYVTNTRCISVDDAVAMVRAATTCAGSMPSFVLDGNISILVDDDGITVIGIGR